MNASRLRAAGCALTALASSVLACSATAPFSPEKGSTYDGGPGNCETYVASFCDYLAACDPSALIQDFGDVASCIANQTATCLASSAGPGTGFTPTFLGACSATYYARTAACANGPVPLPVPKEGDACQVVGAGAGNAPCGVNDQCASDTCIRRGTTCGQCSVVAQLGETCGPGTNVTCARGLGCLGAVTNGSGPVTFRCVAIVGLGASCDLAENLCTTGTSCVVPNAQATGGACVASGVTIGAPCSGSGTGLPDCSNVAGLYCDPGTSRCAATAYASAGAGCDGTNTLCSAGGCYGSTCLGLIAQGGACSPTSGATCQDGSHCVADEGGSAGICAKNVESCVVSP